MGRDHLDRAARAMRSWTLGDTTSSRRTSSSTMAPSSAILATKDGHDSSDAQKIVGASTTDAAS